MSDDPLWAATVPTVTPPSTPATGSDRTTTGATPASPSVVDPDVMAEPDVMAVPAASTPAATAPPVATAATDDAAPDDAVPERTAVMPIVDRPDRTGFDGAGAGRTARRRGRDVSRRRRLVLRILLALLAIGLAYFLVTLLQVWNTGRSSQAREVDAIVVLGAAQYDGRPSPQLQARLDEVVRLWPQGYAPLVVVTGGKQPGDRFTEAEASARYLIDRGIPEQAIVYENEGATTFESLDATAAILAERGLDRVLLVTDPFHALRSRLIAEEVGMEAYVAPTSTSVLSGSRSAALHVKEAGGVAIGRVIGFERLSGLTG